ncbi:hypothetical protein ABT093_24195 [Kitasatospora sp. NPDC002551]|uniref:hypothetical protein n=1 Tax=Kitasatospora sp. NPDC002551 TaxID=3154539 RepID=UPI003316AE54
MIIVTTSGRIAALRSRGDEAAAALASATQQLEDVLNQQRDPDEQLLTALSDLATARDDLATARDDLASAERTAAEAIASQTASHSMQKLLLRDAQSRIDAGDRTIAELRAELERARAAEPAAPEPVELPEHTVLRFRTVGGGLVVVTGVSDEHRADDGRSYAWQCITCGDGGGHLVWFRDGARRLANDHAGACRAIPTGTAGEAAKAGTHS